MTTPGRALWLVLWGILALILFITGMTLVIGSDSGTINALVGVPLSILCLLGILWCAEMMK